MQSFLDRREFLKASVLACAGAALSPNRSGALEPFHRSGPPQLQLSLAAYSFRQFFTGSGKAPADRQLDLFQFMDFCAEHGCAATELTSYYFPKDLNDDFLLRIRRHAFLRGLAISGTAVGNTFSTPPGPAREAQINLVKQWVDHAAVLGAPHIRIFAGSAAKEMPLTEAKRLCLEAMEECGDYAGRKGAFLGIENHGGIVAEADGLLDIVRAVQCPWVGSR